MLDHLVEIALILHNLYLRHHNGSPYGSQGLSQLPGACPWRKMVHRLLTQ